MPILNINTAKEYVLNYFDQFIHWGQSTPVIKRMNEVDYHGERMIEVHFTFEDHINRDHVFAVWIEGDKLYGEW